MARNRPRTDTGLLVRDVAADPETMTPRERRREVAILLARGLRKLSESAANRLDADRRLEAPCVATVNSTESG